MTPNAYRIVYHDKDTPWNKTEVITIGEESTYHVMELFNENINYDVHCVNFETLTHK